MEAGRRGEAGRCWQQGARFTRPKAPGPWAWECPGPRCHGGPGPAPPDACTPLPSPPHAKQPEQNLGNGLVLKHTVVPISVPSLFSTARHSTCLLSLKLKPAYTMDLGAAQWRLPLTGCLESLACQVMPVFPRGREALVTHKSQILLLLP